MTQAKIFKLFLDVHMGASHDGLTRLAEKAKLDVTTLQDGDMLMFLNRKCDKLKVLGARGKVIGYLRMEKGQRIMRESIQFLPRTFGAGGFDYNRAVSMALDQQLSKRLPFKKTKGEKKNQSVRISRKAVLSAQLQVVG